MSSTTARRLLLVSLVLATLWAAGFLTGCASIDVQCGMRADYNAAALPAHGRATFAWSYGAGFAGNQYGEAIPAGDVTILRLRGDPPTFNDICGLARLGHEVAHAMGATHERPHRR